MKSGHLKYRPEVAGLRAFAVLSVLIFHVNSSWLPGGFVGVDIFFVISGYLISRIIFIELDAGTFSISNFYARRIKRILPALITVLIVCWIYGYFYLFPYNFKNLGKFQNTASFFYSNFEMIGEINYFDISAKAKPLLHLWSLSIEEQFYIFWPPLIIFFLKLGRRFLPVLIFLALSSFVFGIYKTATSPLAAYYLPWTRSWELILGGIVAWREVKSVGSRDVIPNEVHFPLSVLGLALLGSSVFLIDQNRPFPGWVAIFPTLGAALILSIPRNRLIDIVLGNRLGEKIGSISYPLYLWHWPILAFAHLELGDRFSLIFSITFVTVSFGLAWATLNLIELPISRVFERYRKLTVTGLLIGLVSVGVLGIVTHDLDGMHHRFSPEVARILNFSGSMKSQPVMAVSTEVGDRATCSYEFLGVKKDVAWHTANIIEFFNGKSCFLIKDLAKPTIALVGDSHGSHLSFGLRSTLGDQFNILDFSTTFCVPLIKDVVPEQGRGGTERCKAYNKFVFEQLRQIKPDIILAGIYFLNYVHNDYWFYPNYIETLNQSADALLKFGIGAIVLVGQVPTWSPSLKEVIAHEVQSGIAPPIFSFNGVNRIVFDIDRDLKAYPWADKVHYVSLIDTLCNSAGCRRRKGEKIPEDLMAEDYGHLSLGGSEFIFREILRNRLVSTFNELSQSFEVNH